jgi:dUTPase.
MNVTHVSDDEVPVPTPTSDRLCLMFTRQTELMKKYHDIEERNGFPVHKGLGIDDRFLQHRIKDFAWRVTEEITESTTASSDNPEVQHIHELEEMMDAWHFMLELNLTAGIAPADWYRLAIEEIEPKVIPAEFDRFTFICDHLDEGYGPYAIIEELGNACNCLKNKPWKTTHMMTDKPKFYRHLMKANLNLLDYCMNLGMTSEDIYRMYFMKSEVNKFRQRTNY